MATQQKDRNPGQQEYNQNFNFDPRTINLNSMSQRQGTANESRGIQEANTKLADRRPLAARESAPIWDTNLPNGPEVKPRGGQSGGGGGGNRLQNMLRRRAAKWVIGGVVSGIVTISMAAGALLTQGFLNVKQLATDWANHNNNSYYSKYSAKYFQKKFFQADPNCNSGAKCRLKTGVSDAEIQKFKDAGLNPEVGQAGDKKYIKAFNATDESGKPVRITADNFEEHYGGNIKFRGAMDKVAKPSSMFMRGKTMLKNVFDKFGILRNRDISGADEKERAKNLREDIYSNGNPNEKINTAPDGTPAEEAAKIAGVDESIQQAAQAEHDRLVASGFTEAPSIVPDTTGLDLPLDKAPEVAGGIIKGGLKGALFGVFTVIDKACSGYQVLRATVFGAKVIKALQLMKYLGIFMVLAEKEQVGDAKADEVGYAAGLMMRPSTKKDSYGKTFFQSEGFNMWSQGKIADHRGLARWTTASSFLKLLQDAKKTFESFGANKETCKVVSGWQAQLTMAGIGVITDILSGGTLSVGGVVASVGLSAIIAVITAYATPLLIQYAAGTVSPDPTDPEGGYGIGNAFGAALGTFGRFGGQVHGERVLSQKDAATVEMESNKEMAFEKQVDNYGKSPFSTDSSSSITSQLATALTPVLASPFSQSTFQSMAAIAASPLSLFSSSIGNIVTGGVFAQSDVSRGGQFCADDEYNQMGTAVDAWCNPITGEKDAVINDPRYAPDKVDDWMYANNHADPETGEPTSDDFKKYVASCQDSIAPPSPDGGGSDVGENIDTRWCMDSSDEFNHFRFYLTNSAIESDHKDSVEGTLGQDTASVGDTTAPVGGTLSAAQCQTATGGQKVACNAAIFEPYYYLWGGGHGSLSDLKSVINDALTGKNKGAPVLDCSGLVRAAYYMTYGIDFSGMNSEGYTTSSKFVAVPDDKAQPGDVLWHPGHVAIVASNDPSKNSWHIVEAPHTGSPIRERNATYSEFTVYHYTGAP